MLDTRVRVRPWSCLCTLVSEGRWTRSVPSSWTTFMSGCRSRPSVPLGPSTVIARPSTVTVTSAGTVMGRRPIRDIYPLLPDVGKDFAAELCPACLRAGHDPLAGADDDDAEAPENPRDVRLARVDAQSGLADPLESGHDGHLAVNVLELEMQDRNGTISVLANGGDEAFVLEDAGDLTLGPRRGNDDLGMPSARRVADPREHVRDGIGDIHRFPTSSTSSRPAAHRGAPAPGSRSGTARTAA